MDKESYFFENENISKLAINKFSIDKNLDPYLRTSKLLNYIENFVNQPELVKIILYLSNQTGIPKQEIEYEIKQYLGVNFNFSECIFSKNFRIKKIFNSIFIYLSTFIWAIFFSKSKKNIKCELIIDEITEIEQAKRCSKLISEFPSSIFISKVDLDKNFNYFKFDSLKGCLRSLLLKNFFKYIFSIFFFTIKSSVICKTNLMLIVLHVLKRIIKYDSIFTQINAKFLFQERSYTTSAIKNFLFKKNGGKITSCIQRNIIPLRNEGLYINIDIFFSLGNKTTLPLNLNICGAKIKKIVPVGSFYLETKWFSTKRVEVPEYDLINICGNAVHQITHNSYVDDYYEHFRWIVKLSKEFPNLKIACKHPAGGRKVDKKGIDIIKNTAVEIITDGVSGKNYSYGYAFKAKFLCAWNSTMTYEILGHNKPFFFLDPGGRNIGFLHNDNFNNNWRLKSYKEFKKKAEKIILSKEIITVKNTEDFCLYSDNVSKKIVMNLMKNI